jgi:hypothetical protein
VSSRGQAILPGGWTGADKEPTDVASDLRDVVLDTLCHFSCPLGQAELDAYARVYHGRAISEPELQALRRSERLAWLAGERRRSWVCAVIRAHDDFPGVDLEAVERFGAWETIAEDAFGLLAGPDRRQRDAFAAQLAAEPVEVQLFGGVSSAADVGGP